MYWEGVCVCAHIFLKCICTFGYIHASGPRGVMVVLQKKSSDFKVDWVLNGCWSRVEGTMSVYTEEEKNNISTDSRGS